MKKIGILGGTFDPPHMAHFIIADEVRDILQLDEVWFIPTNEPPHKGKALTNNHHRLQMLKRVIEGHPSFRVHDYELNQIGKSYTIDTVNYLTATYPSTQFFFIIGADMVEYLPNWKNIDELIQKIQFVGVKRKGSVMMSEYPVLPVDAPLIEISSTDIRERVKNGQPFQYFVPKEVYTYIKEQRLYEYRRG